MKIIAMIPARYAATRFPAKLMQVLGDKTVIRRTYEAVLHTGLFDEVYVVTDSEIIYKEINENGGQVLMSTGPHESGSDRIAAIVGNMEIDVVVNVQGDEPFIHREPLEKLVSLFKDPVVKVGSLMKKIDAGQVSGPDLVKVVVNNLNDSIYFSRSVIPYVANGVTTTDHYVHIGVYGYRKEILRQFTTWPAGKLEQSEKLEQLRYLENGIPIRMALVEFDGMAIDTPEDLDRARNYLNEQK